MAVIQPDSTPMAMAKAVTTGNMSMAASTLGTVRYASGL